MGKGEYKGSSSLIDWRAWQYQFGNESFVTTPMATYAEDSMLICAPAAEKLVQCVLTGEPLQ